MDELFQVLNSYHHNHLVIADPLLMCIYTYKVAAYVHIQYKLPATCILQVLNIVNLYIINNPPW
jgi:hypothetical protein